MWGLRTSPSWEALPKIAGDDLRASGHALHHFRFDHELQVLLLPIRRSRLQGQGKIVWFGPGGESILQQPGEDIIVFHAYDSGSGHPYLQISSIAWVHDWPEAALNGIDPAKR